MTPPWDHRKIPFYRPGPSGFFLISVYLTGGFILCSEKRGLLTNRDVKTRQIRAPGNQQKRFEIVRSLSGTNERFARGIRDKRRLGWPARQDVSLPRFMYRLLFLEPARRKIETGSSGFQYPV